MIQVKVMGHNYSHYQALLKGEEKRKQKGGERETQETLWPENGRRMTFFKKRRKIKRKEEEILLESSQAAKMKEMLSWLKKKWRKYSQIEDRELYSKVENVYYLA